MTRPSLLLNDGVHIPQLGLGVMHVSNEALPGLMVGAVAAGYRHFDTASHYRNEAGVGDGLRRLEGVTDDVFITTKLPNWAHGFDQALRAFEASEAAIGRVDLYLIHWPQPSKGLYRESWRALVRLRDEGRVRSIGVANFTESLLRELVGETGVAPAVNQIELHPSFQQRDLRAAHAELGIATESWSPLEQGKALSSPVIEGIARESGVTPAQLILGWHLHNGLIVIPKASNARHLRDNIASSDLSLDPTALAAIDALDRPDGRFGPDPATHFT